VSRAGRARRTDQPAILVVHPDGSARDRLVHALTALGFGAVPATTGEEAIDLIAGRRARVVLLDLDLPGMSGLETLRALRALATPPEVVVTGPRSLDAIAEATRFGAFRCVPQPLDVPELSGILRAALERAARPPGSGAPEAPGAAPPIVGQSPAIRQVLALIRKAAPSHSPVLIQGESGTGKELVARAIHAQSPRALFPLTIVDCGALQDTLLESELFGHERGAFTGAHALKHGLFETAHQGAVFLDEIGEMSPVMQVKVLRALESGEFRRVGGNRLLRADIRVIAATNRDLREEVARGRFREDLYYRLAVIEVSLPPLRERPEDIPLLVEHFLGSSAFGGRPGLRLTAEAMDRLVAHPWPGNIRELRNCIERLCVLVEGDVVTAESLPPRIAATPAPEAAAPGADLPLEAVERVHILRALERHQWNRRRAAASLGVDVKTLYNKLRRYGIRGRAVEP
jgi:DNA-binding NtrC family response regulator